MRVNQLMSHTFLLAGALFDLVVEIDEFVLVLYARSNPFLVGWYPAS